MKIVIIAVMAVVLLGGGAAGAYFFLGSPAEAAAGPADEAAKAAHEAKSGAAVIPTEQFVNLDVLILPVIDERGVTQTITMVVTLEVPDEAAAAEVKRLSPRLKDAYIQDMYGTLSRHSVMKDGVLQTGIIKSRLSSASKKVLGEDKVNDVLLQVVQQRRI